MSTNKSNELIQRASHNLDSIQLKFWNKVVDQIDSEAKEFKQFYYVNLKDFIEHDLKYKDNKNFTYIYEKLKEMRDHGFEIISKEVKELRSEQKELVNSLIHLKKISIEEITKLSKAPSYQVISFLKTLDLTKKIQEEVTLLEKKLVIPEEAIETTELYTSWFSTIERTSISDIIRIEIPKAMEKFYLGLKDKGNYSIINAKLVYKLRNKYSIRFYELIYSYRKLSKKKKNKLEYEDYIEVSIPYRKLRTMLKMPINKYKDYRNFKRYVLNTAKTELKEKNTDIQFDFEASGRGDGKSIIFKIYNIEEEIKKEEAKKKQDLINNGDDIDKQIYTDIEKALKDGGVSKSVRNSLISKFDEMRIRRNIEMQYKRLANKKITRKELPGALVKSIKEDWAMGTYEENKKRIQDKENNKNTFDKPLPTFIDQEVKKEKNELDKQKEKLKNELPLWFEFLTFLSKEVEERPNGYVASVLPRLQIDKELIYSEGKLERFIGIFFKMRF